MAGPGLAAPNAALATVDVVFTQTASVNTATTSVPSMASGSSQRDRRGLAGPSGSLKKTPRLREARAARVGGKRRPLNSTLGARPGSFVSRGVLSPRAGAAGSTTTEAWRRIGLRLSRFVMIFFRSLPKPARRAHEVRVCASGCREACAHCLLQMQNIHVMRTEAAGRRSAHERAPTYAINMSRIGHARKRCTRAWTVAVRSCARPAPREGDPSGHAQTARRESMELKPRRRF
jgi:hypothetical protein